MKNNTSISSMIFIYIIAFLVLMILTYKSVITHENQIQSTTNSYEEKRTMQEQGLIKVGDIYLKYGVKEHGEVKPITDILNRNCKNDQCKIENYFDYVKKIPYRKGEKNKDKNSIDVIVKGAGDCDEKSYLFTSMLLEGKYKCLLIYTKNHTFVCVNIPNLQNDINRSYISINNVKYYYAETTQTNAYIGAYNLIDPKDFLIVYDPITKKEVPIHTIQLYLNQKS